MDECMFSVIVPAYNAQDYIKRCVDSVFNGIGDQTEYELLVVDDGSSDKTGALLDELEALHEKMYVTHTDNQGVSHARNTALEKAVGKYIIFLDADDYLLEGWFAKALTLAENDADFTVVDFVKGYEDGKEKIIRYEPEGDLYEWCREKFLTSVQMNPVWSRLYKRELIEKHRIRFDESVDYGEDFLFSWHYFLHCKNVGIAHRPILYKEERDDSLMHNGIRVGQFLKNDAKIFYLRAACCKGDGMYQKCLELHFRGITNLMLWIAVKHTYPRQKEWNRMVCGQPYVGKILEDVRADALSIPKRIEISMLRSHRWIWDRYIRLKAHMLWMKKDVD